MSVFKSSKRNLWICKWREDGKEKRRYFPTEGEARAFESERLVAPQEEARLTLGELALHYFKGNPDLHYKTRKTIIRLLGGYEDENGRHIEGQGEFLRDKYADSLNHQDLQRLRDIKRSAGAGPNTINKHQAYLHAILSWGVDQDLIARNPWRDIRKLKVVKPIIRANIADLRRLYPELPPFLQWAVKTAFFLALRPGQIELFGLTWDAFIWQRNLVVVRQGKTGRIKTVVPHPVYMDEARNRYEADRVAGIEWVVHRANGQRIHDCRTAWQFACKRAGVKMRPYDIRHIAATEMLARGADLAAVSAQLGHSNVVTTGTTYTHVTPGSQATAAGLMPTLPIGAGG